MDTERKGDFQRQPRPPRPVKIPTGDEAGNHALLLTYKDGTKATVLKIGGSSDRWNFACRVAGRNEPLATAFFNGPWGNFNLFSALSHAIAHFFRTGHSPYPVERTLLVSGILDAAMHSHHDRRPIDTPHLELTYQPQDFRDFREMVQSWRVVTVDTPQPTKFEPEKP
jgi:hypothetical protein